MVDPVAPQFDDKHVSRRGFVVRAGSGAGALLGGGALAQLLAACGSSSEEDASTGARGAGGIDIPTATVSLGIGPYVDHSYWIIGVREGWFDEVGINIRPEPAGRSSEPDNWGPILISGAVDLQSASESHYLPSMSSAPNLRQLVWTDVFQGFGILAQPDLNLKSVEEFMADGMSPRDALTATMEQLRGKRFLFPPETGAQGFVDAVFSQAGMTLSDVEADRVQDAKQVPLMLTGRADAQVSGVPTRLNLEARGMKVLVTAGHLVQGARPSADSPELLTVFRDGAATTQEWFDDNTDTALRFSSVAFRIADFIEKNPQQAAEIQRPFVNSISGTDLSEEEVLNSYSTLNPFYGFDSQRPWYENEDDPLYYEYEIGAQINQWEEEGQLSEGEVTVDQVALNAEVYRTLSDLQRRSKRLIDEVRGGSPSGDAVKMLELAEAHYGGFNFLDAERFAQGAKDKA